MGKSEAQVTANNIQRCEKVTTSGTAIGTWIQCFSKKVGDDNNSVKLVFVNINLAR